MGEWYLNYVLLGGGYKERAYWSPCPCFYLTFQVSLLAVSPEKRRKVGMALSVATVCTLVQPYTGHLGSEAFVQPCRNVAMYS